MRFMHNIHNGHASRETPAGGPEPPRHFRGDCRGEKHNCGSLAAVAEPTGCQPRPAARPSHVWRRVACACSRWVRAHFAWAGNLEGTGRDAAGGGKTRAAHYLRSAS